MMRKIGPFKVKEEAIPAWAALITLFVFLLSLYIRNGMNEPEGKNLHTLENQLVTLSWEMSRTAEEYKLFSK